MTVFTPFKADTDYFPAEKAFMLNLRVDDLVSLIAAFRAEGIAVETRAEWENTGYGDFARVCDPEGNLIEMWKPLPAHGGARSARQGRVGSCPDRALSDRADCWKTVRWQRLGHPQWGRISALKRFRFRWNRKSLPLVSLERVFRCFVSVKT